MISIHFIELFYTSYTQVKATSITQTMSGIGGLNGLWFGMSVVSLTELLLFLSKISWIMVSRRRRHHLFVKKESEKRKEQNLEVAVKEVEEFRESRSRMSSAANLTQNYSNPNFWYRNPYNFSNSSMNSVASEARSTELIEDFQIHLEIDVNELKKKLDEPTISGRISVTSHVKFEDIKEDVGDKEDDDKDNTDKVTFSIGSSHI